MFFIMIICICMPLFACHIKSPTLTLCKIIHHPPIRPSAAVNSFLHPEVQLSSGLKMHVWKALVSSWRRAENINLSLLSCQSSGIAVCPSQPLVITLLNVLHIRICLMIFHTSADCFELFEDVNNKDGNRLGFILFPSHLRVQINSRLSL